MKKIVTACTRYPVWVIGIILLITAGSGALIPLIKLDARSEIFIKADNPVRVQYEKNRAEFGAADEGLIGIVAPTIYDRDVLAEVFAIGQAVGKLPRVQKVQSILNMDYIQGSPSGIEVAPLSDPDAPPGTDEQIRGIKAKIDAWPFLKGSLVARDDTGVAISFTMQPDTQTSDVIPVYYAVQKIIAEQQSKAKVFVSGVPIVTALTSDYMVRDMRLFIPLVALVMVSTLFLLFRNLRGVLLPLLTVGISTVWTLGLMALLQWPLTLVTITTPVMLASVGNGFGIHLLQNVFVDASLGIRGQQGIINAAHRVSLPIIMAGLTTMGGFFSLVATDVVPIKQLGVLTTFGVGAALIISLTFIPAVLSMLNRYGREIVQAHTARFDFVGPILRCFTYLALKRSKSTIAFYVVLLAISVYGALLIESDMDPVKNFKAGSPVRIADEYLNQKFAGTSMFNVVVAGAHPDDIKDPAVLRRIETLQNRLNTLPGVGKTLSIVDLLKRMNQVMHDDDPAYYIIPDSRELVAQYLLLYSFSGSGEIERFVNPDFQKAQVVLVMKSQSGDYARRILSEIDRFRQELQGTPLTVAATGISAITMEFNRLVVHGHIASFALAVLFVILATMPIFKSFKLGLFSIVPLCIPVCINFAIMGFCGLKLNAVTAIIASITIGVGISYTIHFLARYRYELSRTTDVGEAITGAMQVAGRAIIYNAMADAAGYAVLACSSFIPILQTGALISLTMFTSSTAALTALPAVINAFHPRIKADGHRDHIPTPAERRTDEDLYVYRIDRGKPHVGPDDPGHRTRRGTQRRADHDQVSRRP